jgi:hypothetical protein
LVHPLDFRGLDGPSSCFFGAIVAIKMGYHAVWSISFRLGLTKHDPSLRQYLEMGYFQNRIAHQDKTKPAAAELVTGLVSDMMRSNADLLVENALLRQQLIVLKR